MVPAPEELRYWWECYRKVAFATAADARVQQELHPDGGNVIYPCSKGATPHYHLGRPHTGKRRNSPSQFRKAWLNRSVRPSLEELAEAYRTGAYRRTDLGMK